MRHLIVPFLVSVAVGCTASATSPSDNPTDPGAGGGGGGGGGSGSGSDQGPHVDPTFPTEHPRIYLGSQRARLDAALASHTPPADRFVSTVNSWLGGADFFAFPAWNAALLGELTHDARYCTSAIAQVDTVVTTAEAAITAGRAPEVARDSYLYIGEEIGDVVLTYDWCYAAVTPAQRTRWIAYADQAVWNVWHNETASWGGVTIPWTGWSVDNPSNNYYYSFLRATMLLGLATKGENPHADEWIAKFRDDKIATELVPTFDADLTGGGSREGTGYGQSMRRLFELYDFWQATTGERIADLTEHTRASMLAYVHETMPTLDRTAPIGDHSRDSSSSYFDYDRDYLIKLVALFPSDPIAARVKAMLASSSVPQMDQAFMRGLDFLYDRPDVTATALTGMGTSYYAAGTGVVSMRSSWAKDATWVGMIAGPYTESHAHQDQGSIMMFKGDWLSYDACHDTHSGVRQELDQHSLVRLERGGQVIQQRDNTTSKVLALHRGDGWMHVAADVTAAYRGDADVGLVQRELVYLEPDVVVVYDRVRTTGNATQTWAFVSPVAPSLAGSVTTFATAHPVTVKRLAPASASSASYDFRADSDYIGGYRLDEAVGGGDQRYLHVVSIGGAVNATASGDSATTITYGGHTATIEFARDGVGGTLVLDGVTHPLTATVDVLPE
ncbi:MAG: hypothetical protein NT062_19190 [Proteobacteria bacterium]|nr:hypothetical protein [Pseudomonadota bacterium]